MFEQTPRGGSHLGSANWLMVSASRDAGGGVIALSMMGSLETLTLGDCGYPRLLASGPDCTGDRFDVQLPHPPVMELAARYVKPIHGTTSVQLMAALAGEPALGPPSFVHRASAAPDPVAPLSHHDMNPAHASAGVVTLGLVSRHWRIEASAFNGEPMDPDRLPDVAALRSAAARLTFQPSANWSVQVSTGRLRASESHHSGGSQSFNSTTASLTGQRNSGAALWSTTIGWARMDDGTVPQRSVLVENAMSIGQRHTVFARIEAAERIARSFTIIENPDGSHEHINHADRYRVAQLSAGYGIEHGLGKMNVGLGARASASFLPGVLEPRYAARRALGFALFLSLRPVRYHH